jgi:hypothetical protein
MIANNQSFFKSLKSWSAAQAKQDGQLHEMAVYALSLVNRHGTVGVDSPIQKLWDTVQGHKAINRQALMSWMGEYGMLRFMKREEGEGFIIKYSDKTKKDATFDPETALAMATEIPFWEFAKEPTPNATPYDVHKHLAAILQQAKAAATGGKNGDKPKRAIEHAELLDVISYIVANGEDARRKLGLTSVSEDMAAQVPAVDETVAENNREAGIRLAA